MFQKLTLIFLASLLFAGCASVPMESEEESNKTKEFSPPSLGNAGLYIYRAGSLGGALKKDIWINGKCIGETAPNIFFYEEVKGGEEYKISTESEFSPNDLFVKTESDTNYFIKQYIKMGVFVGGANLKLVDENEGKEAVSKLKLAKKGICSN